MPNLQFPTDEKKHSILDVSLKALSCPVVIPKYSYSHNLKSSKFANLQSYLNHYIKFKRFIIIIMFLIVAFTGFYGLKIRKFNSKNNILSVKANNPDFVGREQCLKQLYQELLSRRSHDEFAQSAKTKILWGKGGFGKSEIAIEFANRYSSYFSLIWTFYCDTEEHLNHGYRQLAEKLNICSLKESPEKIRKNVNFYLENSPLERPWLLIFDNLERVSIELPQRGGIILATSQKRVMNPEFIMEIEPLTEEESLLLVEQVTGEKRGPAMKQLVENLEGIPLLINYAAHYIKATPGCTVEEYERLFSSSFFKKDGPLWKAVDVNQRYSKSLAASWDFPLKSLERENPQALAWLFICSYLYPEQIPEKWIDEWLCHLQGINHRELQPQQRADLQMQRKSILSSLQSYGIIHYEKKMETFSLHRFFQHFIRENRKEYAAIDLGETLNLLANHAKDYDFAKFSSWKEGEQWILHASTIKEWLNSLNFTSLNKKNEILLYEGLGNWYFFHDRYLDALESHSRSLNLRDSFYPKSRLEIAVNHLSLARTLFEIGRYPETMEACEKAKKILVECTGDRSVEREPRRNLAPSGASQGEVRNKERILAVEESPSFQEGVLQYGNCLHILGRVFFQEGEYQKALECHEQTLHIFSERKGQEDFEVGTSLYNIALCRGQLKENQESIRLFERAMKVYYKAYGEQHPFFARALYGKAWALYREKQYQKSLDLFHKSLSIFISTQGVHSGYVAHCWNRMGRCLIELKKTKKAKKIFKKALKNGLFCYGENSRPVLQSYRGLGLCYFEEGKFEKGLHYFSKELQVGAQMYPQPCKKLMTFLEDFRESLKVARKENVKAGSIREAASIAHQICEERWGQTHSLTQFFFKEASLTGI